MIDIFYVSTYIFIKDAAYNYWIIFNSVCKWMSLIFAFESKLCFYNDNLKPALIVWLFWVFFSFSSLSSSFFSDFWLTWLVFFYHLQLFFLYWENIVSSLYWLCNRWKAKFKSRLKFNQWSSTAGHCTLYFSLSLVCKTPRLEFRVGKKLKMWLE